MRERAGSSQSSQRQNESANLVVYVVDDDPVIRRALEFLLTTMGYDVVLCASGDDFLERYVPDLPGCVLLDVRMPGMSGFELQALLQRQATELPVIMMSGNVEPEDGHWAATAGVVAIIAKPFDNELLLGHVRAALAERLSVDSAG